MTPTKTVMVYYVTLEDPDFTKYKRTRFWIKAWWYEFIFGWREIFRLLRGKNPRRLEMYMVPQEPNKILTLEEVKKQWIVKRYDPPPEDKKNASG